MKCPDRIQHLQIFLKVVEVKKLVFRNFCSNVMQRRCNETHVWMWSAAACLCIWSACWVWVTGYRKHDVRLSLSGASFSTNFMRNWCSKANLWMITVWSHASAAHVPVWALCSEAWQSIEHNILSIYNNTSSLMYLPFPHPMTELGCISYSQWKTRGYCETDRVTALKVLNLNQSTWLNTDMKWSICLLY